jgi:hypothetical protein
MAREKHPKVRLVIDAPANGRLRKATVTALDESGAVVCQDAADLTSAAERTKAARRLSGRLKLPPADVEHKLEEGWNKVVQEHRARKEARSEGEGTARACPGDGRPAIVISTEEHLVNEQASEALAADPGVYQRAGLLVRVAHDAGPAAAARRPLAPRVEPLPPALVRERLAACARWVEARETENGLVERKARPPGWCVAAVHARGDWPGVRPLEGVLNYPVLLPDGTVLSRPGYHPGAGLLLEPSGCLPQIPEHPTRDDATRARDVLLGVVADFPFQQPAHRAAWLAGLLTPLARFAFAGPAPLFLVDANTRGAGKGLLLHCVARVVTGEDFTVAAYTQDEDELRKRITSLVVSGASLVLFDNLEGKFGNGVLDAALTGTRWEDRLLGVNRMVRGPLTVVWYATGNNVMVGADTARRACHVRLESPEERPEERQGFEQPHLLRWVGEQRPRLLAAALTILRGYCAAGKPDQGLPPWGSFEGWSALVRSAVVWAGLPDPGETRLLLQVQADVTAEGMDLLLECWERMDPERRGLTAAQVIATLYPPARDKPASPPPEYHADMRAAVEQLVGRSDSRALGNTLRRYRRRIFGGRFIDQAGKDHSAARWAVFNAADFGPGRKMTPQTPQTPLGGEGAGESGESGEFFSDPDPEPESEHYDPMT